jgi:CHAT domain-containing protein/tetratricopeptide (TPR) repeat protein
MIRQPEWLCALFVLAFWCGLSIASEAPSDAAARAGLADVNAALAAGRQSQATAAAERTAAAARAAFANDPAAEADLLLELGSALRGGGQVIDAMPHFERAVTLRTTAFGAADGRTAEAIGAWAAAQGEHGDFAAAEANHLKARALLRAAYGDADPRIGLAETRLGQLYTSQKRFAEAETALLQAGRIARSAYGATHEGFAYALIDLGELYSRMLRFSEAERAFAAALPILTVRLGERNAATAHLLDRVGNMQLSRGRFADAERYHIRALDMRRALYGPDHIEVAQSASNLGLTLHNLARFQEAESLFRDALAVYEARYGLNHAYVSSIAQNLALVFFWQGRYDEAELLYQRVIEIRRARFGEAHKVIAGTYNTLAHVHLRREEWNEAEPLLRRAAAIWAAPPDADPYLAAEAQMWLGAAEAETGRLGAAQASLDTALRAIEQRMGRSHVSFARGTQTLAELLARLGERAEAERLFGQALATYREIGGPEYTLTITGLDAQARATAKLGDDRAALALAREAVAGLRGRLAKLNAGGTRATKSEVASLREVAVGHVEIAARLGRDDATLLAESFEAAQLARATSAAAAVASMAVRFAAGDDALADLVRRRQDAVERWKQVDAILTAAAIEDPLRRDLTYEAGLRRDMQFAAGEVAALDSELGQRFPAYGELANPKPESIERVRQLLRPGEAMLNLLVGKSATFVWAVDRERILLHRSSLGRAELEGLVRALRKGTDPEGVSTIADVPRFDTALAHRLYAELVAPLEPMLASARHVLIVPDESLQSLPFALLATGAVKQPQRPEDYRGVPWFGLRYAITVLPSVGALRSLRVFAARTAAAGRRSFLGFGNPVLEGPKPGVEPPPSNAPTTTRGYRSMYRSGKVDPEAVRNLDPLPDTEVELKRIAAALNAPSDDIYLAERATVRAFRGSDAVRYRILVFATHGLMAGDFSDLGEPALVLTPPAQAQADDDGLLTASEIAAMRLDADWVVLSACNTAAADGTPGAEGLSGLAKSFFYAGSRALLVSHWPVASEAAARLTTTAFDALEREPKIGRAEAVRRAMKALIESADAPYMAHPLFWAPFSLVGEGGAD